MHPNVGLYSRPENSFQVTNGEIITERKKQDYKRELDCIS